MFVHYALSCARGMKTRNLSLYAHGVCTHMVLMEIVSCLWSCGHWWQSLERSCEGLGGASLVAPGSCLHCGFYSNW